MRSNPTFLSKLSITIQLELCFNPKIISEAGSLVGFFILYIEAPLMDAI